MLSTEESRCQRSTTRSATSRRSANSSSTTRSCANAWSQPSTQGLPPAGAHTSRSASPALRGGSAPILFFGQSCSRWSTSSSERAAGSRRSAATSFATLGLLVAGVGAALAVPSVRSRVQGLLRRNDVVSSGDRLGLEDGRREDRGRRAGDDRLRPVDAVRGLPELHGRRGRGEAARRHAAPLGRDRRRARRPSGRRRSSSRSPNRRIVWESVAGRNTRRRRQLRGSRPVEDPHRSDR